MVCIRLICLASLIAAGSALYLPRGNSSYEGSDWDYFLFVQEYPPGFCYKLKGEDCFIPRNATLWTMHGLWPTANGTIGPSFCKPSEEFEPSDVKDILPQLVQNWPNLETNSGFYSFWSHEWLKHGTCASGVPSLETEELFFSTVLKLHSDRNFGEAFKNAGIVPSNSTYYKVSQFEEAFQNEYGVRPVLTCESIGDNTVMLYQVGMCLEKDFSTMPCAEYVFEHISCKTDQDVLYVGTWY